MNIQPYTKFRPGDFLPTFIAKSSINPRFEFNAAAGRPIVLCFIGSSRPNHGGSVVDIVRSIEQDLHDKGFLIFFVTADPDDVENLKLRPDHQRTLTFWDLDLQIHKKFGMASSHSGKIVLRTGCFVIKQNLRLVRQFDFTPLEDFATTLQTACDEIQRPPVNPSVAPHAPVLVIPDVFDRDLCRRLIAEYDRIGGQVSGVMRDVDGVTTGFYDTTTKRRRDAMITDPDLLSEIRRSLGNRVVGEIRKAFAFEASHIERFMVGCYDASDQGFFKAHRDNSGAGTAHRRFAVTLNLNSEEYDGGHLWFPEYGPNLYKPETGSALVFSCSMLHEARPVSRGRRYAFLPFLFDAAAAKIRGANRKLVKNATPPEEPMPVQVA